jgi:hypothetical protein
MLQGQSMPPTHVRFTIGRLMNVVAVAGVLIALLRTQEARALAIATVLIFGPLTIAYIYPFYARPGRRLLAATWVAALWPLSILWTLHVAWGVAYGFLGHSQGPAVINYSFLGHSPGPAHNGNVINVLTNSVAIVICLALFSTIFCLLLQLFFVSGESIEVSVSPFARAIPILLMLLIWYSVVMICRLDPLGAVKWFLG